MSAKDRAAKALRARIGRHLKAYVKSTAGRLFLSTKRGGRFVAEDVRESLKDHLGPDPGQPEEALLARGASGHESGHESGYNRHFARYLRTYPTWWRTAKRFGKSLHLRKYSFRNELYNLIEDASPMVFVTVISPVLFALWILYVVCNVLRWLKRD